MELNVTDRSANAFNKPGDCVMTALTCNRTSKLNTNRFNSIWTLLKKKRDRIEENAMILEFDFALSSRKTVMIGQQMEKKMWNLGDAVAEHGDKSNFFNDLQELAITCDEVSAETKTFKNIEYNAVFFMDQTNPCQYDLQSK